MSTIDYEFTFDLFGQGEEEIRVTARLMSPSTPPSYDPIYGGDPGWSAEWDIDSLKVLNSNEEWQEVDSVIYRLLNKAPRRKEWQSIIDHIQESIEEDVRASRADDKADMARGEL